jgi:hypothetical protein
VVATAGAHLDGHLVRGTADAAVSEPRAVGLTLSSARLEGDDRVGAGLVAAAFEGAVDDRLGSAIFLPSSRILLTSCDDDAVEPYTGSTTIGTLGSGTLARH